MDTLMMDSDVNEWMRHCTTENCTQQQFRTRWSNLLHRLNKDVNSHISSDYKTNDRFSSLLSDSKSMHSSHNEKLRSCAGGLQGLSQSLGFANGQGGYLQIQDKHIGVLIKHAYIVARQSGISLADFSEDPAAAAQVSRLIATRGAFGVFDPVEMFVFQFYVFKNSPTGLCKMQTGFDLPTEAMFAANIIAQSTLVIANIMDKNQNQTKNPSQYNDQLEFSASDSNTNSQDGNMRNTTPTNKLLLPPMLGTFTPNKKRNIHIHGGLNSRNIYSIVATESAHMLNYFSSMLGPGNQELLLSLLNDSNLIPKPTKSTGIKGVKDSITIPNKLINGHICGIDSSSSSSSTDTPRIPNTSSKYPNTSVSKRKIHQADQGSDSRTKVKKSNSIRDNHNLIGYSGNGSNNYGGHLTNPSDSIGVPTQLLKLTNFPAELNNLADGALTFCGVSQKMNQSPDRQNLTQQQQQSQIVQQQYQQQQQKQLQNSHADPSTLNALLFGTHSEAESNTKSPLLNNQINRNKSKNLGGAVHVSRNIGGMTFEPQAQSQAQSVHQALNMFQHKSAHSDSNSDSNVYINTNLYPNLNVNSKLAPISAPYSLSCLDTNQSRGYDGGSGYEAIVDELGFIRDEADINDKNNTTAFDQLYQTNDAELLRIFGGIGINGYNWLQQQQEQQQQCFVGFSQSFHDVPSTPLPRFLETPNQVKLPVSYNLDTNNNNSNNNNDNDNNNNGLSIKDYGIGFDLNLDSDLGCGGYGFSFGASTENENFLPNSSSNFSKLNGNSRISNINSGSSEKSWNTCTNISAVPSAPNKLSNYNATNISPCTTLSGEINTMGIDSDNGAIYSGNDQTKHSSSMMSLTANEIIARLKQQYNPL